MIGWGVAEPRQAQAGPPASIAHDLTITKDDIFSGFERSRGRA